MTLKKSVFPKKNLLKKYQSNTEIAFGLEQQAGLQPSSAMINYGGIFVERTAHSLRWIFFLPWLIGIIINWRRKKNPYRLLLFLIILLNGLLLCLLLHNFQYIDRRHLMPLILLTAWVIPDGILFICTGLRKLKQLSKVKYSLLYKIFICIGICFCLPKLIRPALIKKEYYHTAISWLRENTEPDSEIGTFDPKITFYAERKSIFSNINTPPQKGDFWVQEITPDFETAHPVLMTRQVFAYPHPHENKTVSIFDMKGYINESISLIDFHYQWIDKRVLECVFDFRVYQYPKSDYTISVRSRFEKTVSNKKETKTMILSFIPSIPTGSWQDGTTIQVKKRLAFPPVPMKLEMFFYIPNGSVYGREVFLANISDPVQKPVTGSD